MSTGLALTQIADDFIGDVCEMIANGVHYREIARKYCCSLTAVFLFVNKSKHQEQVRAARENAAFILVEDAAMYIAQAKKEPKLAHIYFQMASHNKWYASMIYGRQFAQRKIVGVEDEGANPKKETVIRIVEDADNYTILSAESSKK